MKKLLILAVLCLSNLISKAQTDVGQTIVVPVVFHLSGSGFIQNITVAQAQSQIDAINRDFSATNVDFAKLALFDQTYGTSFMSKAAANGIGIQFCLAKHDPSGNPTTGIVPGSHFGYVAKRWDHKRYLNVYIENNNYPFRGEYRKTENEPVYYRALSVRANCFGTLDAGNPNVPTDFSLDSQFKEGGILTHEIGHYFGLDEAYYDSGGKDLGITDLPPTNNDLKGCPSFFTLGYGDFTKYSFAIGSNGIKHSMFMNFMDYADDPCKWMFTKDQRTRMRASAFGAYSATYGGAGTLLTQCPTCPAPINPTIKAISKSPDKMYVGWQVPTLPAGYSIVKYELQVLYSGFNDTVKFISTTPSFSDVTFKYSSLYGRRFRLINHCSNGNSKWPMNNVLEINNIYTTVPTCNDYGTEYNDTKLTAHGLAFTNVNSTKDVSTLTGWFCHKEGYYIDEDWYVFTVNDVNKPNIKITLSGAASNTKIQWFQSDGTTLINETTGSSVSWIWRACPPSQINPFTPKTYLLKLSNPSPNNSNYSYTLSVERFFDYYYQYCLGGMAPLGLLREDVAPSLQIRPTSVKDILTLDGSLLQEGQNLYIQNMMGKRFMQVNLSGKEVKDINVSILPQGIYIIYSEDKKTAIRFIKE